MKRRRNPPEVCHGSLSPKLHPLNLPLFLDIGDSQLTPQPPLTGQLMEVEINSNSTVGTRLMAAPNAVVVQNVAMEQTGATTAPIGSPLQRDVQVDSKNDTEKTLPLSEPAIAEELILVEGGQESLPEALEAPVAPMEVDHGQMEPIHQVEPTHEDSQHMDMDVDNPRSVTESGHTHNAEDSQQQSSAMQEPENQSSPNAIIPPVSVLQPASPPQLSEPAGLSSDIIPVSSGAGSEDQVREHPMPLQALQKPDAIEVSTINSTVVSHTYRYYGAGQQYRESFK